MAGPRWWQTSVLYEILVPSFQDSNGDGWGDLGGIVQRLDYLVELGIGALWLSPFYSTPMFDVGYDVADYRAVDPRFGTMDDFQGLLSAAHERDLRVLIDYVPNHTSNEHPWFQQARRSRSDPKRDWYLWADPGPDGGPPNNWIDRFGHSAWTFDSGTGQYYFGTFAPEQPDLNWRNRETRQAMLDILRFWFELGVDGMRVDALPHLLKDCRFRNNPPNPDYNEDQEPPNRLNPVYSQNQPDLLDILGELRRVADEFPDRVLVGEAYQPPEQIAAYQRAGVHLLLNISMLQPPFEALRLRQRIDTVEALTPLEAWPSRSAGNHDIARLAERVGPSNLRLAALLQFTVRGAASIYYGDELGLKHLEVPQASMHDPSGRDNPRYGRDRYRAPMPWDGQPHAGFSTVEPWLTIDQETVQRNVRDQSADPDSLLNLYRRILRLRSTEPDLQTGDYCPLDVADPILAFRRGGPEQGLLVALNVSDGPVTMDLGSTRAEVLLSTTRRQVPGFFAAQLPLEPREGIVARAAANRPSGAAE